MNPAFLLVSQVLSFLVCCHVPTLVSAFVVTLPSATKPSTSRLVLSSSSSDPDSSSSSSSSLDGLSVAIVGAGPSGLLLSHYLLKAGASNIQIVEGRGRPRSSIAPSTPTSNSPTSSTSTTSDRAYALGVGIRGRTAIQSIDPQLWEMVKTRGYESERFTLYIGNGLKIRLRDGSADPSDDNLEPSVLMYQSDLCAALLEGLEQKYITADPKQQLSMVFDQPVTKCDLETQTIETTSAAGTASTLDGGGLPFDLIVGCDGVNSVVRKSIQETDASEDWFQAERRELPGVFKVCRLDTAPPKVDPTSVALLIPQAGTITAFVEPTANNGSCILFAGGRSDDNKTQDDPILYPSLSNLTATVEALEQRFPLLEGCDFETMAQQLANQRRGGVASSVRCNTYHYGSKAVLVGDAAHATGGVSGQGLNSALQDVRVLANCLTQHYDANDKTASIGEALLRYSQSQVPEGLALYDLSFGPKPKGLVLKARYLWKNAIDNIFRGRFGIGRQPLQTLLTTTLQPFADVRRNELGEFYKEEEEGPFPTQEDFNKRLESIDRSARMMQQQTQQSRQKLAG